MPLLLWWSVESKCEKDRERVLALFRDSTLWRAKIPQQVVLPRLMKRFALAGSQKDYQTCVALFRLAPTKADGEMLLRAFEEAFKGRSIAGLPPELLAEIARLGGGSTAFGVRQGQAEAIAKGLALIRRHQSAGAAASRDHRGLRRGEAADLVSPLLKHPGKRAGGD